MRHFKLGTALLSVILLAGCGGENPPQFSSLVSFGDSLSDVGTYSVGTVKALGGGKYTVNAPDAKNWIELMASRLNVAAPCAAQTGLNGDPTLGFSVPVMNFPGCTAYAQGGARVTNPVGPGNRVLGGANAVLGQLTVPVVTQIQNHLNANGGSFKGDEIVFVMAGANDAFIQLATIAAGGDPAMSVAAMGTAGAELAAYVKSLIVGRGAQYVTVVNVPDASKAPGAAMLDPSVRSLLNTLVTTFNMQLQQGLSGVDVLYVDAYTASRDQIDNPSRYGISNVTTPACDLSPEKTLLGTSLICTTANTIAANVEKFLFADMNHPTPYGYQLLADLVTGQMRARDWL